MTIATLSEMSTERLTQLFKETSNHASKDIYTVRGWIIDALESKMTSEKFDEWLDLN